VRFCDLFQSAQQKINRPESDLDLQILVEHAFGISRQQFWSRRNREVKNGSGLRKFYRYVDRLKNREPVAYITKSRDFYTSTFFVNRNVLIPRPETELLVEQALKIIRSDHHVLDIGAGCGNISISLALHTQAMVTAVEKSKAAIYVLKKNLSRHRTKKPIRVVEANLFPPGEVKFDIIVSNPPYVSAPEWRQLPDSVKLFEPRQALVGGKQGHETIGRIIRKAPKYLAKGGLLFIEIGYNQKDTVMELLRANRFKSIRFFNDYNKIPRLAKARL
jgi:release factor glutamine methyltransferase